MSFVTASAQGLELVEENFFTQPVDFVAYASGYTLVALLGWWQGGTPSQGAGLFRFADEPKPRGPDTWAFTNEGQSLVVQPISTHAIHDRWKSERQHQAVDRSRYTSQLQWLEGQYRDQAAEIAAWREHVQGLPEPDVVQATRNRFTASREVGVLPLHGPDGAVVDALACDHLGNAATASGHDWLESIASQWVAQDPRPDLAAFLKWAAGQRPHGSAYPGTPAIRRSEGSTKRIAAQVAAGIL